MTKIMPFPENNNETVLLDRPFGQLFCSVSKSKMSLPQPLLEGLTDKLGFGADHDLNTAFPGVNDGGSAGGFELPVIHQLAVFDFQPQTGDAVGGGKDVFPAADALQNGIRHDGIPVMIRRGHGFRFLLPTRGL